MLLSNCYVKRDHGRTAALDNIRRRRDRHRPRCAGPRLLLVDEQPGRWEVRQILDDPAGDHDWGISATVDLAASDEAGDAVVTVSAVDQL